VSDLSLSSARRLWRYYQAGIVNTLFGYGLFALFVKLGLNMYLAQICAHVLGAAFNYYSYSRHVFHDAPYNLVAGHDFKGAIRFRRGHCSSPGHAEGWSTS